MEREAPAAQKSSMPTLLEPLPDRSSDVGNNLPCPVTSLIGREQEIANACTLLQRDDVRLVTFTGTGGVGKTQLALAVARQLNHVFADGAVFVPLAPVTDPVLVVSAIAQAFEIRDTGARPLLDGLRASLRDRELLLLVDNFEHVLAAAPLMVDLLSACPYLKVLVTSRALLYLSGEHTFDVPPLGLPDSTGAAPIEVLTCSDAIRLFVARAREAKPDFVLTDANAGAVAEICRSLDGLPLAIELAAARVRVLSPPALLALLKNRLQVLTGGHRDAPERLQTMRNAIAWSYDLLSNEEQRLFRLLSIFVGGFTLDGAEAVGAVDSVLVLLTSLVDKSLVQQAELPDGETRFSMLETIREFGLERLEASGEAADLRARHAAYFMELAEWADHVPITQEKENADRRLEAELPNIRAVLAWAAEQQDIELLLRMPVALGWFWEISGSQEEARTWLVRAVEATARVPSQLCGRRAHLLATAALMESWGGAIERATVLLDEGLPLTHEAGDARAIAMVQLSLGHLAIHQGDWDRAVMHLQDALARWRRLDEPFWILGALFRLGYVATLRGEHEEASAWHAECLEVARSGGWSVPIAFSLEANGTCARELGDYRQAAVLFGEALTLVRDRNRPHIVANCLKSLGAVAAVSGEAERGTRLFGAADALRERTGNGPEPAAEQIRLEQAYAPARAQLSGDTFATAWAVGRDMPLDQAIAEALEVVREVMSEQPLDVEAPAGLTPREIDVLRLLVEGLSDKEVAEVLGISRRTASKHVETILSKLDVPSRTAAATYATRHGLI